MKKLLLLLGVAVICLVSPACDMHPADTLKPHGEDSAKDQAGH